MKNSNYTDDIYTYPNSDTLKNKLDIHEADELNEAEANYTMLRLRELAVSPIAGNFDSEHLLSIHRYIFQDIYDWAGEIRTVNIEKPEPILNEFSVEYSDYKTIEANLSELLHSMNKEKWNGLSMDDKIPLFCFYLASIWKVHPFREGNTRSTITFMCQFAENLGFSLDGTLFEEHSTYFRTTLVAYNAVIHGIDYSKKTHLIDFVKDAAGL